MLKNVELKTQLSQKYETEYMEDRIQLPLGIKIGIEIESGGYFSGNFLGEIWDGWKGKEENEDELEVISPVLTGTEEDAEIEF